MNAKISLVTLAVWLVMPILGITNGLFRQALLEPRMSVAGSHLVSLVMLIALLFAVALAIEPYFRRHASRADRWVIGATWMILTVAFETLFGHYVLGSSWATVLDAYNPLSGDLWVLVPLFMLAAPTLARLALARLTTNPTAPADRAA